MPKPKAAYTAPNDGTESFHLDPIIEGLLERLPPPGDVFLPADRQIWLKIIADVFQLVYLDKEPPESDGGAST